MNKRKLGPFEVAEIGLGCMNLSHGYGPPTPEADAQALLRHALERGVTLFDTAALYGFGANEALLGRTLGAHRREFVLASKCVLHGLPDGQGGFRRIVDGRPETIRWSCEQSLQRLGTEVIDLFYLHRWDRQVPIEDSVGAVAELVRAGKVRALGLSEVSAATLRRAYAVHPVAALQTEYSLWTRNPEIAVLEACRELGIAFVAFSPLGRGFLGGALRDVATLDAKDMRRSMPRFEPAHYARNLALLAGVEALARRLGASLAQLALAWLLARGEHVIPIPGTTCIAHLDDNLGAAGLRLDAATLAELDALVNARNVVGARYDAVAQAGVDTEEF